MSSRTYWRAENPLGPLHGQLLGPHGHLAYSGSLWIHWIVEPRSPALQADSSPAEPQGKPLDYALVVKQFMLRQKQQKSEVRCRIISDPGFNAPSLFFTIKSLQGSHEIVCIMLPTQGRHRAGPLRVNVLFLEKNSALSHLHHKRIYLASIYEHTPKRLIYELEETEQRTSCFSFINSECLRFTMEITSSSSFLGNTNEKTTNHHFWR